MTIQELRRRLALSPFLADCPLTPEQVWERRCPAGQILSGRPAGTSCVGLILSGQVEVYSVSLDGRDVQLNRLGPGECFGISSLLAGEEPDTVLRCAEETRLLYISRAALLACLEREPRLALRYAGLCNRKLQFLLRRIELLTMQSCRGRVIAYLLAGQDASGRVADTGPREELARRLGVSRAALFRELAALQSLGLLRVDGGTLTVLDQTALEQLLYHPFHTKQTELRKERIV